MIRSIFIVLVAFCTLNAAEKPLVVVVPSYNNIRWCEENLSSIAKQDYTNYRVLYVNDASTDGTGNAVESFLQREGIDYGVVSFDASTTEDLNALTAQFAEAVNREKHKFLLVNNKTRCKALANLYRSIHSCQDQEIMILLDGDDWFYDNNVLQAVNEAYCSGEVWFTHGMLIEYPWGHITWCEPLRPEALEHNSYREFKCPSHLRTFYAWIFKKINLEDFLYQGVFFPMTWDMAIMFPIAEMAGKRHHFFTDVNYVYNMESSINDNKVNAKLQNDLDYYIRHMPRYQPLKEAPNLVD